MARYILLATILKLIDGSKLIATSTAPSQDLKIIRPFKVPLNRLRSLVRSFALL